MTPAMIVPPSPKRGKRSPKHKMSNETNKKIKSHVNLFNPAISHYRREYAPLRKYLSPELTICGMYKDFNEKNPGLVHYATYQKVIKHDMNISFAKLGEEECECEYCLSL